jgi:hypothetical protein
MTNNDLQADAPEQTVDTPEATVEQPVEEAESPVLGEQAETTDWETKAKEMEADNAKLSRQLNRAKKKADAPAARQQKTNQSDGLDYGQKAYLKTEGIESSEFDFVQDQMQESGLSLDSLLSNNYFKSELQTKRDAASVEAATPGNTRGAPEGATTKAEYWMDKDFSEVPPELKREVLNKKVEREKGAQHFSSQGVVRE